jgi:hypothetical protein
MPRGTSRPRYLTTREFAAKHNVSDSRIRQLLAQERIFPAHKLGRVWVMYSNSVIIAPYDRPNRRPEKMLTEAA